MLAHVIRCAAYPVVFGGVAVCVLLALGGDARAPWPIFGVAAVAGILLVALLERLLPFAPAWNHDQDDTATDSLHLLVNFGLLSGAAYILHVAADGLPSVAPWPAQWPIRSPLLLQVVAAGAILDFSLYAMHRLSHRIAWLWRLHAIHHSSTRLYWMNGERRHPLSALLLAGPGLLALALLGTPPAVVSAWLALLAVHLAFQHANIDYTLGPLRRWIAGAELHRWHHRRDYADAQVNFGEFWLIWDWLFGTRFDQVARVEASDVGLSDPRFPTRYMQQMAWPFRDGSAREDADAQ